ncbi:uncharacterized protein LOC125673656 isoform X2 [Ostrea edulis]|uniref:uncharacterized protein LOC125673656 isoform X2 n=1 Tax=Ostrea edulis TaxID=37623 RepID=UPI0024AFF521|nr:uncharacterized protein LOC125673656 isoform X2 [Ostrea edulis]
MSILTIWIYAIGLQSTGILSYTQHFMSDNVMPWHDADIVCPKLFNPGKGVVHLAGNLTSDPEQIQVLRTLKNQESFWLDGIRYHLGCNEMSCEYLRVQHRIGAKELKAICIKNGLEIESNCNKVYNLTSIADQSNLHTLSEYGNGEELRINQADIKGILKECRLATRTPNGFRIKYQNCAATHKVLCQKHSKVTSIVTTLVYQRTANAVDTEENVYVRMTSTVTEAYDTKGVWDTKWLITTCLSGMSCILSVIICIYLCYRKHIRPSLRIAISVSLLPCSESGPKSIHAPSSLSLLVAGIFPLVSLYFSFLLVSISWRSLGLMLLPSCGHVRSISIVSS